MTLSNETAQVILNFYDEMKEANKNFKQCQSIAFKNFAGSSLESINIKKAFDELRKGLTKPEKAN